MVEIVCAAALAYIVIIFVSIVLSYVVTLGRLESDHPANTAWRATSRLVDPVFARIRTVVKPIRVGGAMLDLSPLIVIIVINLARGFLCP